MAVPNTTTFSLNDVRNELGLGASASLQQCISVAEVNSYDPDYTPSPPTNNLLGFRNYNSVPEYFSLIPCLGGATAYTRLKPTLGTGQRYVNSNNGDAFTWNGSSLSSASPPAGFNGSIQRTNFVGC